MKRFISLFCCALMLSIVMSSTLFAAERYENLKVFGPAYSTSTKDPRFTECFAGLVDFLYVSIGSGFTKPGSDFVDYWRDFTLYTSHYADVYGIERQLNASRYAVISTFLKCQTERFSQVTSRYYALEAELYFVRHFIDTFPDGFPDRITADEKRREFQQEFIGYMISKTPDAADKNKQLALFGGYFDQFMAKYKNKVVEYRDNSTSSDPAWGQLKQKWEGLMRTFSDFGSSVEGLGGDAADLGEALVPSSPGSLITSLFSRVDACAEVGSADSYCVSDAIKYLNEHDVVKEAEQKRDALLNAKRTNSVTFGEVQIAVDEANQQPPEDLLSESQMLKKYEVLYGAVNSDGITQMITATDTLLATLTKGRGASAAGPKIPGSLEPLTKISQCADDIEDKQCN